MCFQYPASLPFVLSFKCFFVAKIYTGMNGKSDIAVIKRNPLEQKEYLRQSFGGNMKNEQNTTCIFKIHSNMRGT